MKRDEQIIDMYFERSESAITETQKKYEKFCMYIAENILGNRPDAEECVNDAYLALWESIPPARQDNFSAYLGRIVRNISITALRRRNAAKRGFDRTVPITDELAECLGDIEPPPADNYAMRDALDRFLDSLPSRARIVFVRRYWYMCSVRDIARDMGMSAANVKVSLYRTRGELKKFLEQEGVNV